MGPSDNDTTTTLQIFHFKKLKNRPNNWNGCFEFIFANI